MGRLDGKVAAVTGGASGIGEATVRRFVAEGASVAFCDRDGERGERVAAELETAGAKIAFTQADVGTEAACLAFVNGAGEKFGRLDILVNNAGIRKYEKVEDASGASWAARPRPRSPSRSQNATLAPSATKRLTVASPIPDAPPVTAATLPSSLPMFATFHCIAKRASTIPSYPSGGHSLVGPA